MTHRHLHQLILALAAVLFAILAIDHINFTIDDVFITLRYVENWVRGKGLTYNPGEWVEGYSNWLWVMLLSVPASLGVTQQASPFALMWWSKGISICFGVATMFIAYRLCLREFSSDANAKIYASLAVLTLAISGPFIMWSVGGLEMTLVSFLLTLVVLVVSRTEQDERRSTYILIGILLGLVSLARPEMPLFAFVVIAGLLISASKEKSKVLAASGVYLVIMIPFMLWRWTTYHDIVPNTYYSKTVHSVANVVIATKYTLAALAAVTGPLLLLIPGVASKSIFGSRALRIALLLVGTSIFFSIYSSGDWMPGFRFLIPTAPLAVFALTAVLRAVSERVSLFPVKRITVAFMLIALTAASYGFMSRTLVHDQVGSLALGSGLSSINGHALPDQYRAAMWLRERYPNGGSVATNEAGMIGYFNPQMRLIDLSGLMDVNIALDSKNRKPLDANYVLAKHPDVIMLVGIPAWGINPIYLDEFKNAPAFAHYRMIDQIGEFATYVKE